MKKILLFTALILLLNLEAKVAVVGFISKPVGTIDKDFDDSEIQFGIAVQPYLTDNIVLDMRLDSSSGNKMADGGKTDLERMSLNLLYDFDFESGISPYIFAGSGYEKLHRKYKNIQSQAFLNAGVGLKIDLNDDIDMRSELRYIKMSKTKDSDIVASLGIGVKFGYENCEVVCEEDILEKKPVTKPVLKVKPAVKAIQKDIKSNAVVFDDEKKPVKVIKKYTKVVKNKVVEHSVRGGNYIQVAALSDKNNLKNMLKKLKTRNFKVRNIKKGSTTVVLVGPYSKNKIQSIYKRVKMVQKDAFYKKL